MSDETLFRRVRKPCCSPWCSRIVQTLAYVVSPRCQPCRRRVRGLRSTRAHALHRERVNARRAA